MDNNKYLTAEVTLFRDYTPLDFTASKKISFAIWYFWSFLYAIIYHTFVY